MKEYLIVANGDFLVREIILEAMQGKIIIALDGAANKLRRIGIAPHVILGDFDSIDAETQAYWGILQTSTDMVDVSMPYVGSNGVIIVPTKDQGYTDLEKAIAYCDLEGAECITIICATGGREDHHEGVKMALRAQYKVSRPIILHTEQQSLRYACDETIALVGKVGDYCGIIATRTGTCTSLGLKYECSGHSESICNSLHAEVAVITVKGSALLIMPPLLASQRAYMEKSEAERLRMQLRDVA